MVNVRLAKIDDCKACAELSKIKELETNGDYVPEDYFKLLVDDDEMFFIAEFENKIVGFIVGEPMKGGLAFMSILTVDTNLRGKGIGKLLVEAFRKRCDEKGLKFIVFYAPKFNENTIEFYKKQGFNEGKLHVQFTEVRN